jgi:hypothetical protein
MARTKSRELYELVKSLDKNEKRYFKVMFSTSQDNEDKKMLMLFDYMNQAKDFDEDKIPLKIPVIKSSQLPNMKSYLHEKILQSLRQYHLSRIPDMKIREQIDFAQLLVERRQYTLALSCIKKAKKMARQFNNHELQLEILRLEKELLLQTDGMEQHADDIISEVRILNSRINNINTFSNLSVKLNSLYRKIGFIKDESQHNQVREYFYSNLPQYDEELLTASEKMYLYRLFTGYYFFIQDFDHGYTYARKLETLFHSNTDLIKSHPEIYVSSLNTVLNAEFKLNRTREFEETSLKLQGSQKILSGNLNENLRIRLLKYSFIHHINNFFLKGEFDKGIEFIRQNTSEINDLSQQLDIHSSMILSYKIACLYFGAGNHNSCIRWLNKIINMPGADVREDLHCFARILNLICHYELGNFDVISYYIVSTYRFLLKKDDLHLFQKFILNFLKNLPDLEGAELTSHFRQLRSQLTSLINSAYEKRAFIYFDIISWLDSKIEKKTVQEVIQTKISATKNT